MEVTDVDGDGLVVEVCWEIELYHQLVSWKIVDGVEKGGVHVS